MWKLKVLPNAVFAYYCFDKRTQIKPMWTKKRESTTELSVNSARKMKRCIQWLIACSDQKQVWEKKQKGFVNWRVNHGTLTFHENMKDDQTARKILSGWLEVAKYRWNMRQYVWKAEPQARGAIHFHFTSNVYIPHEELRYTWNRALRKFKLNNITDNSTDIHAVVEERNMLDYFSDYLTDKEKHEGRRKIKGRLWGSSQDLTEAGKAYIAIDDEQMRAIEYDMKKYCLRAKIAAEGHPVPDFLNHVNYWLISPDNFGGEVKQLFESQTTTLKLPAVKKQFEFWERN